MKTFLLFLFLLFSFLTACSQKISDKDLTKINAYIKKHPDNGLSSKSTGSVSNGKLNNGKLLPFKGNNYQYFDKSSYLNGKAFLHSSVKNTVLKTYLGLERSHTNRQFRVMECGYQHGGALKPHRTHQNGTSVDFMMPLRKDKKPYYKLDDRGFSHYLLSFNDEGKFTMNKSVVIDFETVAYHILLLDKNARALGYKIKKVIIKIELKDELYNTPSGRKLKKSGIYIVKGLTPLINSLHDDHYHIDFVPLK